jgi:hypothetical protein
MTQFYKQYKSIKPYLQRDTKAADVRTQLDLFYLLTADSFTGQGKPPITRRSQEARRPLRMHSLRVLLDILPIILVEQRAIPWPSHPAPVLQVAQRLA